MNYAQVVRDVYENGAKRDTRFGMSSEVIGTTIEFETGQLFTRPKMNRKLGWVEALQVIGGVGYPSDFTTVAPNLLYPYTFDALYGTKIGDQLPLVIEHLQKSHNSRQAIVFIDGAGFAGRDHRPCISSYQFLISPEDRLDTIMSIRSWDLVAGFIYDTMVSNLLSQIVASIIGIPTGGTFAVGGSFHVYHKDVTEGRISDGKSPSKFMVLKTKIDSWEQAQLYALEELRWFRKIPETFVQPGFVEVVTR